MEIQISRQRQDVWWILQLVFNTKKLQSINVLGMSESQWKDINNLQKIPRKQRKSGQGSSKIVDQERMN